MERQSSAFYVNLLRRLFDADGMVQEAQGKAVSVRLTQADAPLLKTVQRMLLRLGVASAIDTQLHELVIGGPSLPVFAQRIGFAGTAKAARLEQALGNYQRALDRERFTATVESVTADGVEPVYDVTVREVHAFDANGLYVHNCGEQPLPPYGCCDLGPIILPRFVQHAFGIGGEAAFDFAAFEQAVAVQVRALDNVLDLTYWPLAQQRTEAMAKRRIGVGFTGLGNTLAMLCLRYDNAAGRAMAVRIARIMRDAAYAASVALAREKGAFPAFDADGYLREGSFASRLGAPLKAAIREHGIRNSHLLSIAPTGTVSLAFADNASNGIEPPFSWTYTRKKREADGSSTAYQVQDHAWRLYHALAGENATLPPYFVTALEMSAGQHLAMMEAVQPFVDTAISKTVNVPVDYPYDDFKGLYHQAWQAGLKGMATYRPNDILGAVLQTDAQAAPATSAAAAGESADPMRSMIGSRPRGALPAVAEKIEYWTQQGRQSLYLVVSFLPVEGGRERAIEFFMPVGQSGESQQWISASMRLMSLAARGGFLDRALDDMRKVSWDRGPVRLGAYQRADGAQVPMWHDSEVAAIAWAVQNIIARRNGAATGSLATPEPSVAPAEIHATQSAPMAGAKCPECGAHAMIRKDGCDWCTQCGHMGSCG
jgi:ribonucleoside-diphosphate reductase alpha chain